MTAAIADIPARTDTDLRLDPEPDESWLALYRYRGQDLPPIARTLLMSAPWQAFATVRRDGPRAVACGRISVAGAPGEQWGAITAVQVDPAWQRQGLAAVLTSALAAAAARRGARPRPAPGRDGQRPGPRALLPVRVPRLASLPLHDCAVSETRPGGAWGDGGFSLRL